MSFIDEQSESIDLIDENNLPSALTITINEDNFALTWAFINYLHEHDRARRARRAVLPQPGDATVGTSKLAIFKEIAKAVLSEFPQYSEHLDNNTVILSYRNAFKNRLASLLKEKTTITNDIFGTGAGVSKPEDLEPLHANIWAEKREACPYYFELVQLINNRDTVVLDGMATPGMPIDISVFESPSDSPSSTSTDSEAIIPRKRKAIFSTPTRGKIAQKEQGMTDSIMSSLKDIMHPAVSAQSTAIVKLADSKKVEAEIKKIEAESSLKEKELQLAKTELELAEKRAEVIRLELALLAAQQKNNE
ncbi:hypothetical protein V1509DRAFT_643639 [Lipomyces kononenkoae]